MSPMSRMLSHQHAGPRGYAPQEQTCRCGPSRQAPRRRAVAVAAQDYDEGFSSSTSSLLGTVVTPSKGGQHGVQQDVPSLADVPLDSEAGLDYAPLRDALQAGEFEKADDVTRANLIELAGPDAQKRGWVYFTEVKFIAADDLQTMDKLWRAASNSRFGFSVQREVWLQNQQQWTRLFKAIDWTHGANSYYRKWPQEFVYSLEANKGHLPLTNCLRGTQLFKAILEHSAFAQAPGGNGAVTPDWMK